MLTLSFCFHPHVGSDVAGSIGERACLGIFSGVHRFTQIFDDKSSSAHATNDFFPSMQELDRTRFSQSPAIGTCRCDGWYLRVAVIAVLYLVASFDTVQSYLQARRLFVLADIGALCRRTRATSKKTGWIFGR